tara:strand:+ start:21 stop:677 length:657 start_codon:yes stop_codon:yes gene_type:complete
MNYSELVQAIKDYTENEETTFVTNIPTFVQQAEERIHRLIIIPELRKNVTATTTNGNQYVTRPSDFLSVFSLAVVDGSSNYEYLIPKDVNFIREAYPAAATSGLPRFYAIFDGDVQATGTTGNFIVGPTPDSAYSIELHYYFDPPSIVTSSTSWLGDNAERVLLYGSLIEAYTFMKGEQDMLAMYQKNFDESLNDLALLGNARLKRDNYRDGEPRADM